MKKNIILFHILKRLGLLLLMLPVSQKMHSLSPDFYAPSSALAQGTWARVEITETGMQLISNTMLRNLGFSDPDKVNVYGFGGRMLSESLDGSMPDDLPLIPSLKVSQGIIFFGHSSMKWENSSNGAMKYQHVINPYSEHSYYFISDRDPERKFPGSSQEITGCQGEPITIFTERLVHEQDLMAPSNTGRLMLGEDFRTQTNRSFNFNLPGNTGDAMINVKFGAKTSGGTASLIFTANGTQLTASTKDQFSASSSSKFITNVTTSKEVTNPGEKLNLEIRFSNSGAISTAALDYIEVEYPRDLKLNSGELYFYLNPTDPSMVRIEGCSESTVVWDVTDVRDIREIPTALSGSFLSFATPADYREYIAFNPSNVIRNVIAAGKVNNQNIHGMAAPGMVIISPDEYRSSAERLVQLHAKTDGLDVIVLSPQQIYNEFSSGNPDVTAFRKMLKMWYDRAEGREGEYPGYCLIMSRPTYDNKMVTAVVKNAGYPRVPIWQSPTGETESSSYSTDDYVGMLADNYGNLNIGSAIIHVAVGRMPVKSSAEANIAMTKLENYVLNPNLGAWRNNVMIIADDQDNGIHLNQAETCYNELRNAGNGGDFLYEKLYLDSYPLVYTGTGATYPDAKQRMFEKFQEGVLYVDYIGHANPSAWGHEGLLNWTDITTMSNSNLPFIFAATCEFLRWDDDAVSGAEEMWLNPNAGVIGMICPSRSVLISANGILNKSTSAFVFQKDENGKGLRVGDIMVKGKNAGQSDSNKLRYGLIGDPAMRLPSPEYSIYVDSINGIDLLSTQFMPEIKARSTVDISGTIRDNTGNLIEDFNGIVEIQIYDAEKVITTYGNGADGVESIYNDRKTRLYTGRVKATSGKWATTVSMPYEIENNYSPALISLYASDENGREANGSCEQFYVYGFDETAPDDFEGPEILEFYLNSPSFTTGDLVSPSPLLYASFTDSSGINLSDAGIGHSMIISIDGKDFYNDVTLYYVPDDENALKGYISYPLSDIKPGEHTLEFTVWDNANNSSTASLTFNVAASWQPTIETLTTDVNPASTSVNFIVATDGATNAMKCKIETFDLAGRKIWSSANTDMSSSSPRLYLGWDLCDSSGVRVPRGIYLYKATVTTSSGATVTKTKKLAVTAQ